MSLSDILSDLVDVKRLTPSIVDKTIPGQTITVNNQPNDTAYMEIDLEGATITPPAFLSISGTSGSPTVEHIAITENSMAISENAYTAVAGITTVGLVGGSISIRAVDAVGQPVNSEIDVATNAPVRFYFKAGILKIQGMGEDKDGDYKMMSQGSLDIRPKDLVYSSNITHGVTLSEVDFVRTIFDFAGATHHKEITFNEIS